MKQSIDAVIEFMRGLKRRMMSEGFKDFVDLDGTPIGDTTEMKINKKLKELSKYASADTPEAAGAYRHEWLSEVIPGGPVIYTGDIETSLNVVGTFSAKTNFIKSNQVFEPWFMISWAARELGTEVMESDCVAAYPRYELFRQSKDTDGVDLPVIESFAKVLAKADIFVGHNIKRFDIPKFLTRCAYYGIPQPRIPKLVDTLDIAKRAFQFMHNNLDGLTEILFGDNKAKHGGLEMWMRIQDGTATIEDFEDMMKYNWADVVLTEKLYRRIRGFSKSAQHPCWTSFGEALWDEDLFACKVCGSQDLTESDKLAVTHSGLTVTKEHQCNNCGHWLKEGGKGSNMVSVQKRRNTLRTSN